MVFNMVSYRVSYSVFSRVDRYFHYDVSQRRARESIEMLYNFNCRIKV